MNKQDKDIKQLFEALKAQDLSQHSIPDFELPKASTNGNGVKLLKRTLAVAASLAILVVTIQAINTSLEEQLPEDITIQMDLLTTPTNSAILLDDSMDIYEWNAETDILIQEFE